MTIGPFIGDKISRDVNGTPTYIKMRVRLFLYKPALLFYSRRVLLLTPTHILYRLYAKLAFYVKSWRIILSHLNDPVVQIQIQIAINLIIMSKEFLHIRSSKSQEFWLPVTNDPRTFRSFPRRIAGYEVA